MGLIFFRTPSEPIREQRLQVSNLDADIGLELGAKVPTFGVHLQQFNHISKRPKLLGTHSQASPCPWKYCALIAASDRLSDGAGPANGSVLTCFDQFPLLVVNRECIFQAFACLLDGLGRTWKPICSSKVNPECLLGIVDHFAPERRVRVKGGAAFRSRSGCSRWGH